MNRDAWFLRFVAAILCFSAVEEVGAASWLVSRAGCGESKLCVETPASCDPTGSGPCLFASAAANQSQLSVGLRGDSAGYVALGLTNAAQNQGVSTLFVCAQNGSEVFFRIVQRNNSDPDAPLAPQNMPVVNFAGAVNGSVITCSFSVSLSNVALSNNSSNSMTVTLLLGTGALGNDSSLGPFNVSVRTGPVDLMNFKNETSTTAAPPWTSAPTELLVSRAGCGESKLCVATPASCDPTGSGPCLFASAAANQSQLSVGLRGDSAGYVALGLTKASQGVSWFFVCGKRNESFFFQTATRNNSVQNAPLTKSNMSAEGVRGEVSGNVTKCVFKIQIPDLKIRRSITSVLRVTLGTGMVNGTDLGSLKEELKTGPLDLSNPKATPAPPTVAPGRAACPVALLSALILPILLTVTLTT